MEWIGDSRQVNLVQDGNPLLVHLLPLYGHPVYNHYYYGSKVTRPESGRRPAPSSSTVTDLSRLFMGSIQYRVQSQKGTHASRVELRVVSSSIKPVTQ